LQDARPLNGLHHPFFCNQEEVECGNTANYRRKHPHKNISTLHFERDFFHIDRVDKQCHNKFRNLPPKEPCRNIGKRDQPRSVNRIGRDGCEHAGLRNAAEGAGSFRGNEASNPFVGQKGEIHEEKEIRFETIFPAWLQNKVIDALLKNHPYEEVAYDIYSPDNTFNMIGAGITGTLAQAVSETEFPKILKSTFGTGVVKHTALLGKPVEKVAVCGGAGSFLLSNAIAVGAGVFVSADFKYHQFFDAENKIVIADVGHFESEQFTKELFYELLTKKFPKFAVHFTEVNTNPVFYF